MTERDLLRAFGDVDDRFIQEAAPAGRKRHIWYRVAAAAACLMLVAGLLALPSLREGFTGGRYKNVTVRGTEAALVLCWEDMTLSERYTNMTLDGQKYRTRGLAIGEGLLGEKIGTCEAEGYDVYTDQMYRQNFEVYEIAGIRDKKLVAVAMEGEYYVFLEDAYAPPATLGQLLETYGLTANLPLNRFADHSGKQVKYYLLENDDAIWQILAQCSDATLIEDDDFRVSGNYLSFTATSEALGIYKKVFYVTEDGYVKTNALEYGYVYYIGQETAGQIMDYALENAAETEPEPYTNFVAGTITEIGDGYILVSDAVLCWNEADGMVFKIMTDAPQFSRWLKYYNFQVGDVVYIEYRGEVGDGNVIAGAYSISEAILGNGDVLVAE